MKDERLEMAKAVLLSLSSAELAKIDIELIKRVVGQYEDIESSQGLHDLDCEQEIQAAVDQLGEDLDDLLDES